MSGKRKVANLEERSHGVFDVFVYMHHIYEKIEKRYIMDIDLGGNTPYLTNRSC